MSRMPPRRIRDGMASALSTNVHRVGGHDHAWPVPSGNRRRYVVTALAGHRGLYTLAGGCPVRVGHQPDRTVGRRVRPFRVGRAGAVPGRRRGHVLVSVAAWSAWYVSRSRRAQRPWAGEGREGVRGNWGNPGLSSFWGVRVSGPVAASISDAPPPCENEQPSRANVVCVGYLPIEWAVRSTRVYPEAVTNKPKSVVEPPAGRSEQGWFRVPL